MYPNLDQIKAIHQKHAPSSKVFDLVFTHCQIVLEIAEQLLTSKPQKLDIELVKAGALLNDIGAYKFIDKEGNFDEENYVEHGIIGYEILKSQGFPESLCRIAQLHIGLGITKEDIIKFHLNLPLKDYLAETLEEKLIMYADKFHSKTPQFNSFDSYCVYVKRFGGDKVKKFQELRDLFGERASFQV